MRPGRALVLAVALAALAAPAATRAAGRAGATVERLSNQAVEAYQAGDYARAVELLRQAYKLRADPVLLYNLGKAEEARGNKEEAIRRYRAFLSSPTGDARLRSKAEARLSVLEAPPPPPYSPPPPLAPVAAPAPAVVTTPPAPRPSRLTPRREWIAGAVTAAVGVAAIAVGAGLYGDVLSLKAKWLNTPDEMTRTSLHASALTVGYVSTAMYVAGGVLAATGAVLVIHGARRARRLKTALAPVLSPHEVGLCVARSF